jgi:hypothetical protein
VVGGGGGEGGRRGGGGRGGKVAVVDSDLEGSDDDSDERAAREDYAAECSSDEGFAFSSPTPLAVDYRQVAEEDALAHELEQIRTGILINTISQVGTLGAGRGDVMMRRALKEKVKKDSKQLRRASRTQCLKAHALEMSKLVAARNTAVPLKITERDPITMLKIARLTEAFSLHTHIAQDTISLYCTPSSRYMFFYNFCLRTR